MVKEILLDTGVITLYFLKDTPRKFSNYSIKSKTDRSLHLQYSPILTETYKHLTMKKGKKFCSKFYKFFVGTFRILN